jgi:hypothetical protein
MEGTLRRQGKLYNGDGEIIAEGLCELHENGLRVSMWPTLEKGLFERERGVMTLELEGGTALHISERRLRLRISPSQGPRTAIYRMHVDGLPVAQPEPPVSEQPEGVPAPVRGTDLPGGLSTAP